MSTTVSDTAISATAAGITHVTVTRVWPSVETATATFSDVYPGQIGEVSPNVARAEDDETGTPFCALINFLVASENCFDSSDDKEGDELCQAFGGLVNLCGLIDEDGNLQPTEYDENELKDTFEDLNIKLDDLKHLKVQKRSFLESYSDWCDSFDDSRQAQAQDPYTQKLLAEGAAGFFGVDIETDEQRASWLKIGQEFHEFYCGDEGGAADLWELISTVDPWNSLAAATSVPLTLVWEGGEAITPASTPTPTPTTAPEPSSDPLDAIKQVGLETSEEEDETPQQERHFDFDKNEWVTSLLTVHETPDAAVQTDVAERGGCANCEGRDCPYCGRAPGITVGVGLLGGIMVVAGCFTTYVM